MASPVPGLYILTLLSAFEQEALKRAAQSDASPSNRSPSQMAQVSRPAPLADSVSGLREPLTQQELWVLRLLAAGRSNQEIAQELVVSLNTVKTHVKNLYSKLQVSSRAQAFVRAHDLRVL